MSLTSSPPKFNPQHILLLVPPCLGPGQLLLGYPHLNHLVPPCSEFTSSPQFSYPKGNPHPKHCFTQDGPGCMQLTAVAPFAFRVPSQSLDCCPPPCSLSPSVAPSPRPPTCPWEAPHVPYSSTFCKVLLMCGQPRGSSPTTSCRSPSDFTSTGPCEGVPVDLRRKEGILLWLWTIGSVPPCSVEGTAVHCLGASPPGDCCVCVCVL